MIGWKKTNHSLRYVKKYIDWTNPVECLEACIVNGASLEYVTTQTVEMCISAVKEWSHAISLVDYGILKSPEFRKFLLELKLKDI